MQKFHSCIICEVSVAICPKCRNQYRNIGDRCENDGFYAVDPEELASGDPIVGRLLGERFVPLRKIGQGGMGVVYEGRQIDFGRVVAIKILSRLQQSNEQVSMRFQREARSIARIVHPNVVQLIDSGFDEDGIAYIVMEYVDGCDLSSIEGYELSGQLIVHIASQTLSALSEAHAMNVIHRDLKPDNIMITKEGSDNHFVKVLDFGLAAMTDGNLITMSGQALGTPWYMSPEQATASVVTATTDIYSLGCVLYELASSKPPFPGNRPFNVMMQHVNASVPPLLLRPEVELSGQMIAFIYKCLEKIPSDRFASAGEALEGLKQVPEWVAAVQSDPSHSIRMVMRQLSEMGEVRSNISSSINPVISSSLNNVVVPRSDKGIALDSFSLQSAGNIEQSSHRNNPLLSSQSLVTYRPRRGINSYTLVAAILCFIALAIAISLFLV